jgi:hypothetical protein
MRTILNIIASEKVSTYDVCDFSSWCAVEVDFLDTIQTKQGSLQRYYSDASDLLATLRELEEICKNS